MPGNGHVVFWTNRVGPSINVSVDGSAAGQVRCVTGAPPACGTFDICLNLTLPVGDHTYTATDGRDNWAGTFIISPGACSNVRLHDL